MKIKKTKTYIFIVLIFSFLFFIDAAVATNAMRTLDLLAFGGVGQFADGG